MTGDPALPVGGAAGAAAIPSPITAAEGRGNAADRPCVNRLRFVA